MFKIINNAISSKLLHFFPTNQLNLAYTNFPLETLTYIYHRGWSHYVVMLLYISYALNEVRFLMQIGYSVSATVPTK